jgi:hypothetical protein
MMDRGTVIVLKLINHMLLELFATNNEKTILSFISYLENDRVSKE